MVELITYYPTGQRHIVEKRVNGIRVHKVVIFDAKSQKISTLWYDNSQIHCFAYYQNNSLHNLYGPACIDWFTNGKIYRISYWQNDKIHNLQGPAFILGSPNGKIYRNDFYHFGKLI